MSGHRNRRKGREIKILRDNMPFGSPGHGEFGTYFVAYSRSPGTIEQMLENMFIGRPPGNYDRISTSALRLREICFSRESVSHRDAGRHGR